MGIKILKTELCNFKKSRCLDCPVCSKWIFILAEDVKPCAKNQSKIRCTDSNEILGEKNEAIIFPNNKVYGINYVKKNVETNGGTFIPRNQKNAFDEKDMMKVYFL